MGENGTIYALSSVCGEQNILDSETQKASSSWWKFGGKDNGAMHTVLDTDVKLKSGERYVGISIYLCSHIL